MRSRRVVAITASVLMVVSALQPGLLAGATQAVPGGQTAVSEGTTVTGNALRSDLKAFPGGTVRLRRFDAGTVVGSSTTGPFGEFAFAGVQPGSYFLELADAAGRPVSIGAPFAVAGTPVTVSIVASGAGTTSASGGGFSLFGLGPAATIGVLGAAAATAVTAATATKSDASPSR